MGAPKLRLTPEQASLLGILAQDYRAGSSLNDHALLVKGLKGDALVVAKLLYGEMPMSKAQPKQKEAMKYLQSWVKSLGAASAA